MIKFKKIAGAFISITSLIFWIDIFMIENILPALFFSFIFFVGICLRKKILFWKACLVFFGLMSFIYSFAIFGGLEPNSSGAFGSGKWVSMEMLIFVMLVISAILSFISGLHDERLAQRG